MKRRLAVVAAVLVAALAIGGGLWIASGGGESECRTATYTVQDTGSPRLMEYNRVECGDERNPPGG